MIARFQFYLLKSLPAFLYNRIILKCYGVEKHKLHENSLRHYLRRNKIDLVYAEFGMKGVIMKDICHDLKIPLIVHFHGGDQPDMPSMEPYSLQFKDLFSKAAAIITVAGSMRKRLIGLGAPEEKTHLVPYGIDLDQFYQITPSLNNQKFVHIGRFVEKKAPYLTILAFNLVLEKYPDANLTMIGDGMLLNSSKTLARSLGIDQNINFAGVLTSEEVSSELALARGLVLHSLTTQLLDREGAPLVIAEAMGRGLPVVSTRHEGINDLVEDGKTGFLVDETDYIQMSEFMNRLLEQPVLADELGQNARHRVEQYFGLNRSIESLNGIIRECLG